MVGEKTFSDSKVHRIRPHPSQCGLHRLLHDLTDLAGHGEPTFTAHYICFNKEHVATGRSPRKTHGNTSPFRAFCNFAFAANFDTAEEFLNDLRGHYKLVGFS